MSESVETFESAYERKAAELKAQRLVMKAEDAARFDERYRHALAARKAYLVLANVFGVLAMITGGVFASWIGQPAGTSWGGTTVALVLGAGASGLLAAAFTLYIADKKDRCY